MTDKIGPTFADELRAAAVSTDGIAWNASTGEIVCADKVQLAAAEAVLAAHDPTKALPPIVPDTVTRAQGRIQLLRMGILDQVEQKVAASSNTELQIWWADASTWRRASTYIASLGAAMSLSSAEIDSAFVEADAIAI